MKRNFVRLLYALLQLTWALPQNLIGFLIFLLCFRCPLLRFRGKFVRCWHFGGSMSLGVFLFLGGGETAEARRRHEKALRAILVHEFGHTVQSSLLGPLFLPVIALPSFLWASVPYFAKWRKKNGFSYYRFYAERWANHLGSRITGLPAPAYGIKRAAN